MSVVNRLLTRTILAKIYANDKCARRYYAPLPQVPHGPTDGSPWRRASRPEVPEYLKGIVHYEFAVEKDAERIMEFLLDNIIPNSPLFDSLGANPNELVDFYQPIIQHTLKDRCSLLGFKGDELIAVSLQSIHEVNPDSDQPIAAHIIPSKDYSSEIDASNFKSRAAKKVACFSKLLREKFEGLLPSKTRRVLFIEVGGVAKPYQGRGISIEMVKHTMRVAREQFHCDYICTSADSKPAQKLFEQKLGYKILRELKLDHFLDGQNPVFICDTVFSGKLFGKPL